MVKLFALTIAIVMSIPASAFAQVLEKTDKSYTKDSSVMGLQDPVNGSNTDPITSTGPVLIKSDIITEETTDYIIEKSASLSKATGQVNFRIAVKAKAPKKDTDSKLSAIFATNDNTDLKDIDLTKVTSLDASNKETEIEAKKATPGILENNDSIRTLALTTEKPAYGMVYYLSAKVDEKAMAKLDEKSPVLSLDIAIKEKDNLFYNNRYSLKYNNNLDESLEEGRTVELDRTENLEEIEADHLINGLYKEGSNGLFAKEAAQITWSDYILSTDDAEFAYNFDLDQAQATENSQILVEFFEAKEKGYIQNTSFTQKLPFAESINLQIPAGQIAKISLTSQVADAKAKEFTFNGKTIANPAYKEEAKETTETKKKNAKSLSPSLVNDAKEEDSILEVSDIEQNAQKADPTSGQLQMDYPYAIEYTSTSGVRYENSDAAVTAIPDYSQNPQVVWDIELYTSQLKATDLEYNNLYYTLFMGAKDGLKQFQYKASTNKADLDIKDGYKTASINSTYLYQGIGNITKKNLGDKLYIRVKAPLDSEKVLHDEYSLGIRVNPDQNYINNLVREFKSKYKSLPTPFKWKIGDDVADKFASKPFDLLDERIVATPQFRKYDVEEQFYFDTTRSITAERFSDTRIKWSILDLIRVGEKEDPKLDKVVLSPADKNNIEKFYYRPNIGGGYSTVNNKEAVTLPDGTLYPGTIVSYNYTNQQGSQNTRYTLSTNLQKKEGKFIDIIKNMIGKNTGLVNPVGTSVEAFTHKLAKSDLDDTYFAYYENPFNIMRINKNFDMVVCFNDGIKNPTYNGSGSKVGLQRIEDPDADLLYNTMFGSRLASARQNLEKTGKFNNGSDNPEAALKDAVKRAYYYADQRIEAWENKNKKKIPRQAREMIYQKMVHHITNDKPVTEHYALANGWYDPNKNDWVNQKNTLYSKKEELSFRNSKPSEDGRQEEGGFRKIPEDETIITKNDNETLTIAIDVATKASNDLAKSYKNNDWTAEKADSVDLVFYRHGYGKDYQNLITAKVHKPLQVQKLDITGTNNLEGAKFKFTNRYTGKSKEWTSEKDNSNNPLYLSPGQYYVEEIDPPKDHAKLDTFIIEVKEEELNPDDGKFPLYKIDVHVNDGYKSSLELVDDPNFPIQKDHSDKPLVSVEEGKLNLNIRNDNDNLGSIEFTKTNGKKILDGAEFKLTKVVSQEDDSPAKTENGEIEYQQSSKGINGTFKFGSMPVGIYKLEETKAPEGYELNSEAYFLEAKKVKVNGEEKLDVNFLDEQIDASREIVNRAESTELTFRKIKETKEGEEIVPLDSGVFRLYSLDTADGSSYDRTARPSKVFVPGKDGATPLEVGEFRFADLVEGNYILEEIEAPTGYEKEDIPYWRVKVLRVEDKETGTKNLKYEVYKLNSGANPTPIDKSTILRGDDEIEGSTFNITNKARTISDTFQKFVENPNYKEGSTEDKYIPIDKNLRGEDGEPVSFRLYDADYYGNKKDPNDRGKRIVADENGLFHLDDLEFSSYYILEEENPPAGYSKAANTVLYVASEAEVATGSMKIVARDLTANTYTIQGKVFKGIIDFELGDQYGDLLVKKTGKSLNDESKEVGLRRAYFRLYFADDKFNYADQKFQTVDSQADSFYIQRVTSGSALTRDDGTGTNKQENIPDNELPNDQGIARFEHLEPGNYILVEHRGPAGYEKDPTERYVKVTKSGKVIKSTSKDDPNFKEEDVPDISNYTANSQANRLLARSNKADDSKLMVSDLPENRQALKASDGTWEDVLDYRSDDPFHRGNYYNQTRITQIDKTNRKFRQVFLLKNPNNLPFRANLHRQPLANLKTNDVTLKFSYVDDDSTVDNLMNSVPISGVSIKPLNSKDPDTGEDRSMTHLRLETTGDLEANKTIAVELEASYEQSNYLGMGMDFFYNHSGIYERTWDKSWAAEKYNSDSEINYKNETYTETIEEIETTPYETQRIKSDKLLEGTEVIFQPGQDGKKLVTYKVTYVNGKEDSREKIEEKIISEKQDEIIHYGTKKDDTPILPSGEKKITVNFLYNNADSMANVDNEVPSEGRAGTMSLQVEKNGKWVDISDKIEPVPYEGQLVFDQLGAGKYRLVYNRDQANAENWGLARTTTFAIDLSDKDKNQFTFTVSNGNLLRVFNKNETGFRIPLRVTKKDENGSALSGAEFTAKKIIQGSEGIYKDEEFDAVSEATGLAGDNYFRELTPGIYELTETQAPKSKDEAESQYETPKNKDGELQKWYFEVKRNPKVDDPRAQNYMIINFNFKHTFAANDKFTQAGEEYKKNHIGETIYGTEPYKEDGKVVNEDFMKLIKLVRDDGRSDPARPDAPYQRINDLEVTNVKKTTKFSFVKTDQYAKSLAGAKFILTKLATDANREIQKELDGDYKFDKNGEEFVYQKEVTSTKDDPELIFENVVAGKYLLEEIEAPKGYKKLENPILIEFRISPETGKWEQKLINQKDVNYDDFIDLFKSGENKGKIDIIKNEPLVTEFKFKKVDQEGNPVSTSAFSLDKVDKDGDLINQDGGKLQKDEIQAYHKVIRHWNSDEFIFDNLSEGRYKLVETNPTTFQQPSPTFFNVVKNDQGQLELVFDDKEENISKDKDDQGYYKFKNFEKIRFDFTKVGDDDKTPLYGAEFTLKKVLTDKKDRGGEEIYDEKGEIKEELKDFSYESFDRSGSYGKIRFRDLSQGVYELEETNIPNGYQRLNAKRKWIITVEKNKEGNGLEVKYDKDYEESYYNDKGDDSYKKDDENILTIDPKGNTVKNKSNTAKLEFNKVDRNGENIAKDTTFIIAKLSDNPGDIEKLSKLEDYKTYVKLREDDGTFAIDKLDRGIYVLRETNQPEGYKKADRDIILQLIEGEDGKLKINPFEATRTLGDDNKYIYTLIDKDFKYLVDNTKSPIEIKNFEIPNFVFNKVKPAGLIGDNKIKDGELGITISQYDDKTQKPSEIVKTMTFNLKDTGSINRIYLEDKNGNRILPDGKYLIKETKAPKGYQMSGRSYLVEVSTVGDKASVKLLKVLDSNFAEVKNDKGQPITDTGDVIPDGGIEITADDNGKSNFQIVNEKPSLPGTGGAGTFIGFAIVGTAVMLAAIAYFGIYQNNKNRRRSNR